ncbi:unnamed protein product [Mycena citricolor]|uniref:NADP-dependent oxidoreductase domain-containing protein n=1 Tax=Mycena citricolor TaxID=2018698 RepID=A0AAD2HLM7_9AGAR|nr:unnamed protein product [Mycena citricolor]
MSFGKSVSLSTGAPIPQIGFGTWQAGPGQVGNSVEIAVKNGYKHLDLAMVYANQPEIGEAFKKLFPAVAKREDIFITSKCWNTSHRPDLVEKELDETLKQLGLDYLDLYLIHWPVAFQPGANLFPLDPAGQGEVALDLETSLVDTWKAMLALPKSKVRNVGVSNFTIAHLEGIIKATGVVPAANQIEAHPLLPQDELAAYCASKNIHITAYSSLGNNSVGDPLLTENPVIVEVANSIGASPAQVLLAWGIKRGYSVIPKSVTESRIVANFNQVALSDADYAKVNALGQSPRRYNIPARYTPKWDIDVFGEECEKATAHKVKIE